MPPTAPYAPFGSVVGVEPGAARSTHGPKSEYEFRVSVWSVAATETTPGEDAGYVGVLFPLLPAAATTSAPCADAYEAASFSAVDEDVPAMLTLITRAPWSTAQVMPLAMSLLYALALL